MERSTRSSDIASPPFSGATLLQRLVDAQQKNPRDISSLRGWILGAAPCPYA